jgi:hypothetical protein
MSNVQQTHAMKYYATARNNRLKPIPVDSKTHYCKKKIK